MLHLEIQNWKDAMKASNFQKDIRGTAECMKILLISTTVCVQLTPNDTYFDDSWFSYVKMVEEAMAAGVDYCGPVKMIHKSFV